MNNKKLILLRNYFDWVVYDLLLMIIGMFIISLLFKIISFSETLQNTVVWGLLIYCVRNFWTLSLISSAKANSSNFSWKFFQSLPLSKKEITFSLILSRLVLVVPIIVFLVLFKSNVDEFFNLFSIKDYNFYKLILNIVLFAVFIELMVVNGAITNPRLEYQKANADKDLISTIRTFLLFITGFLFLFLGIVFVEIRYSIGVFDFIQPFLKSILTFGINWSPLVLAVFIIFLYTNLLDTWTNEIKTYKKPVKWNPIKEWGIIITCSAVLGFFALNIDFATPPFYQGNKLGIFIYKNDYGYIEKMSKNSIEINQASDSGVTPVLMAIANINQFELWNFESIGAHFTIMVNNEHLNVSLLMKGKTFLKVAGLVQGTQYKDIEPEILQVWKELLEGALEGTGRVSFSKILSQQIIRQPGHKSAFFKLHGTFGEVLVYLN